LGSFPIAVVVVSPTGLAEQLRILLGSLESDAGLAPDDPDLIALIIYLKVHPLGQGN
jgi:hypothetical protein